jgi:methylated-DNA-[protein]-cysteine S-methyltransferase
VKTKRQDQILETDQEILLHTAWMKSPVGNLRITASEKGIRSVGFTKEFQNSKPDNSIISYCERQLSEYFQKRRKEFSLPLDMQGTTFQLKVWNELLKIPFGKIISYLELARRLGDEKVIRAAGSANGKNPVAIIVPCHRVIGSNGELVGYGGGLDNKQLLLELEDVTRQTRLF